MNAVRAAANPSVSSHFNPHRPSSSSAAVVAGEARSSTSSSPSSLALDAFRAHNSSLPSIAGSTTLAKVLRVERDFVTVDGGCLKRPVRLARTELHEGQLVASSLPSPSRRPGAAAVGRGGAEASPPPLLRTGPGDVRVGDVLRFHVAHLTGPYGDASLSAEPRPRPAAARAAAWSAVLAAAGAERTRASSASSSSASSSASPSSSTAAAADAGSSAGRIVHGRVLNALPTGGGYAVGVAGVVGFLPFSAAAPSTGARIGALQRFRVTSAVPSTGSFVLEDEGAAARRAAQAKRQAAWAAAKREAAEAAGEVWEERGLKERGEPRQQRQQQGHQRQQQGQQQRGGGSSSSGGGGGAKQQQQQQRGGRQRSQQQRGGAASGREEGWYQPPSSRR